MSVAVIWGGAADPAPEPGDMALCFDALAVGLLTAQGLDAVAADDLLGFDDRGLIESAAIELVGGLQAEGSVGEHAALELLFEFVNVLRAWQLGGALRERGARAPLLTGRTCPSAVRAGLSVALGGAPALATWVPVTGSELAPIGPRPALAAAAMAASSLRTRARDVRVLAVPGMKVATALDAAPVTALNAAGVAVSLFPGLDHGNAARMAVRRRIAAVAVPRGWRRHQARAGEAAALPGRPLHDDPGLDRVLRTVAARVLASRDATDLRALSVLRAWERLPALRAVVLPTSSSGSACLAAGWARRRGLATAVVQHGIYGSSAPQYSDGRVGTLLAWGPNVACQAAAWPPPRPRIVEIGVPGLRARRPRPRPAQIRRVLVATTNRPLGTALGLFGFCEAFIDDLAPGLRELCGAGVTLELRPHPAEDVARYRAQLDRLEIELEPGPPGPFVERLAASDLLVSSLSSVAYEAAAIGAPVVLWTGRTPQALRAEHLLPPLGGALPASFGGEKAFLALARRALSAPAELIDEALSLSALLARYARPFDVGAFTAALDALGAGETAGE